MKKVASIVLPPTCKFLTADIKDFFMSGEHKELIEHSCAAIGDGEEAEKDVYRRQARFITGNQ